MSINGMKQMQGEKRADFIARCQAAQQDAAALERALRPYQAIRRGKSNRVADRIDGYDRDDLGHSPDY